MDWFDVRQVMSLPIAQDWAKSFRDRIVLQRGHNVANEAVRATIETLTRRLRARGWQRRRSSKNKVDNRVDSRYYISPIDPKIEIRISNHQYPARDISGKSTYRGSFDFVITLGMLTDYNVSGLIKMIETEVAKQQRQLLLTR